LAFLDMEQSSKPGSQGWDAGLYESDHGFVWKYGAELLPLLQPQPGEHILDLGCGTGHLTAEIAAAGAVTLGIDNSLDMIGQARQNYPKLKFQLADARTFAVPHPFDAVFSNAALHWVREARTAVQAIHRALKPGGRFVAEFGGKGNNDKVIEGLKEAGASDPLLTFYFPSIGEYAAILEDEGFEVRFATLFDRPTELDDPVRGLENWLLMFQQKALEAIPASEQEKAFRRIEDHVRAELFYDGKWHIDYRRLRVVAVRL
jgi:trans-aconitate 2-methyltransferase